MKLDILAIGAHPDDVEMSCAGTLMKHLAMGYRCGILDLTRGELGTRGSAETRDQESAAAALVMGITVRSNLGMKDGFFRNDEEHQLMLMEVIRKFRPGVVLANALSDRHPDHGRAARLVQDTCFLSGLSKIKTFEGSVPQEAWRPKTVLHYIQDHNLKPDLLVDISPFKEKKMEAILAYRSQFYNEASQEPETYISKPKFLEALEGRMLLWGKIVGATYAEGFNTRRETGIRDLLLLD